MTRLTCQRCGYQIDAAECLEEAEAVPSPNDLSACLNCGMLYLYEGQGWRALSETERCALPPQIQAQLSLVELARHASITQDLAFEQEVNLAMTKELEPCHARVPLGTS